MASPDGEFWRCRESSLFDTRRDELAQMAAGSGFLVIKTQSMMATLEVFRRDDWRFSTNRTEDYGLAYQWERIITTTMGCARFLTHADPLSRSIASVPMRAVLSADVDQGKTSLAKIARFATPLPTREAGDRFRITPSLLADLLQEAVVFVRPDDLELMNSKPSSDGKYRGRCWAAAKVARLTAMLPFWRFERYRRYSSGKVAFDVRTAFATPQNITPAMMREVMFVIEELPDNTHITLAYVAPQVLGLYNSAVLEAIHNNPMLSEIGFAVNLKINREVDPLFKDECTYFILDLADSHIMFANFRRDLSLKQAMQTARETAKAAALTRGVRWEDNFTSNLHLSMKSEKLTPCTPVVEVLTRLEPREFEQDALVSFQNGIAKMRPIWESFERRRVSMTNILRIIRKRRTGVWSDASTDVGNMSEEILDPPSKKKGATNAPLFVGCAQRKWNVRTVGAFEDSDFDEDGLSQGMTPEEFRAFEKRRP